MMTVGQHDDAWLDVMTYQVPKLARFTAIDTCLKLLDRMKENNLCTQENYVESLKMLAEGAGFKFD